MCTAAACVLWNSTVYTYHIHLISPNEISTDLLFTMHRRAAAARHRATACARRGMHTRAGSTAIGIRVTQCQQEREKLIVFLMLKSLCPQITDGPMGLDLIEGGGNYSFHSLHGFAPLHCTVGVSM